MKSVALTKLMVLLAAVAVAPPGTNVVVTGVVFVVAVVAGALVLAPL